MLLTIFLDRFHEAVCANWKLGGDTARIAVVAGKSVVLTRFTIGRRALPAATSKRRLEALPEAQKKP